MSEHRWIGWQPKTEIENFKASGKGNEVNSQEYIKMVYIERSDKINAVGTVAIF